MKKYLLVFISLLSLFATTSTAQIAPNYNVVVMRADDVPMSLPWVGGLNNPQFSNVDLNNDGIKDLFIFDRTGNRVLTFLGHGTANTVDFTYAPEYEAGFPSLVDWALLLDYNCDGVSDIFTYSEGRITPPQGVGIRVYRGYYDPNNKIQFTIVDSTLSAPVDNLPTNLYVSAVDVPAITDVNGDGDVDILTFQPTGGYVQYFENLSEESGFGCDSLIYKKEDNCWGDFFEPALQRADWLDQPCPFFDNGSAEIRHSGSTEVAWDNTGDGVLEMLKGDISWDNLVYQSNNGTPTDAHIYQEDTLFPSYDVSASVFIFPAPFLVDVNNDGLRDLVVAPNAAGGSENFKCSWYYKNVGNAIKATFILQSDTFLVGDMIDVGEGCYPVFFDADNDGLKDLIVGNRGYFDQSNVNLYSGQLSYYRNVGDAQNPAFKLVTKDFAGVKSLNVKTVPPTFGDLDGDGDADMLLGQEDGSLLFFKNTAPPGGPANFVFFGADYAGIDVGSFSTPQLVDVNRDGLLDLLIGEQNGNLDYYQNSGTVSSPSFPSTPTNSFFGGVDVRQPSYVTGYSAPYLFDNNDGQGYQLLVGSQRGTIYRYTNIDNNVDGTFTKTDSTYSGINGGSYATVSGGDINGDGKADLLIGNFRGGVTFYDSKLTGIDEPSARFGQSVHIFPNPASSQIDIRLEKEISGHTSLKVLDVMGNEILSRSFSGTDLKLDIHQLANGIYFLQLGDSNFQVLKKLVVNHF